MEQRKKKMRVTVNNGSELERFSCPKCKGLLVNREKYCPNCGTGVVYPWDSEWKLMDYADFNELEDMIHKMDYTPAPELSFDVNEHMNIYNWLKELRMYRGIGTLEQCNAKTILKQLGGK